jgi:protein-S-isoprenylcysteine O-methyltransferase Ste14
MINGMQICSYLWLTFFALWMLAALRTKRAVERVNWTRQLRYGIPMLLGYYSMFSTDIGVPWLQHRLLPRTLTLAIAAIVVTVAGLVFAVWGRVYLGRNWSSAPTIKEHHELIRSGPYRLVRHPIYTGILMAMAGTFLANGKVRGALAVVLIWFAWLVKSRMEEQFMRRTFGAEYSEYCRTTGALFPRIRV